MASFQHLHLDAEEENAHWCVLTVSLLGHQDGEEDQGSSLETQKKVPAHHLEHIKNVGSLLGVPEADFAVLWVYSTIAQPL